MHYFLDGYNFLFHVYEEVDPLHCTREDMVLFLQERFLTLKLNVTIVFDSHRVKHKNFPTRFDSNTLEIIYTSSGQTADGYILEALAWKKNNHLETVVTSDRELAMQAKALGAKTLSMGNFIKKLRKDSSRAHCKDAKHMEDNPEEIQRLLEAFEKGLKDF